MKQTEIRKTIAIKAPQQAVYQALVTPQEIVNYFPVDDVVMEPYVGGTIRFIGKESGVDEGVIEVLDEGREFRFTYWNPNHGTENLTENHVTISYRLQGGDNETLLEMVQTNIPSDTYFGLMEPVWDILLESLMEHVEAKHPQ